MLDQHDSEVGVGLGELKHVAKRSSAEAAVVVDELDQGDVATWVAEHHALVGVEQRCCVAPDRSRPVRCRQRAALHQLHKGLLQRLRIVDEVVLDEAADLLRMLGKVALEDRLYVMAVGAHTIGGSGCYPHTNDREQRRGEDRIAAFSQPVRCGPHGFRWPHPAS
jgi:hypothetical protein